LSQLIKNAILSWNENGEPSAELFDDLYFSTDDGLDESRYVFIEQNKLAQRWSQCTAAYFVIAETGFGSGLNFLATWEFFLHWRAHNPSHCLKRLYFISFEKYPLTQDDLANAHKRWPILAVLAQQLQDCYPSAVGGCHRRQFSSDDQAIVILDLWFGDIKDSLPALHYPSHGLVDCWYLDGFAPRKNPDMWCDDLYQNIAKCSKLDASLATFTAAGEVRRGLARAGFTITKVKGFGKKREMITASLTDKSAKCSQTSWYYRQLPSRNEPTQSVTIIGGGIASATAALALVKRGIAVTLICKDSAIAQGASGNRQGGFYPLLNPNNDQLSQFYSQAFGVAKSLYQPLTKQITASGDLCGVLQLAYDERQSQRQQKLRDCGLFSSDIIQALSKEQMSQQANVAIGVPGLYYPQGGWISPRVMTETLLAQASTLGRLDILLNTEIATILPDNDGWLLTTRDDETFQATTLVLANGHHLADFNQTDALPMYATAGQVSQLASTAQSQPLASVLCYQGYITPAHRGNHSIGASFERDVINAKLRVEVTEKNITELQSDSLNAPWTHSFETAEPAGKIGVRMSVKDHLPMVGNVPNVSNTQTMYGDLAKGKPSHRYDNAPIYNNLLMLGGLGSRGITSAPLLAEIIAAQISGEPQPVSQQMLNQLNPNRYWIKRLKQGHPLSPLPADAPTDESHDV